LYKIKDHLGVGSVELYSNYSVFVIRNVSELLNILVPILDANPLRTTKYLDYLDFKNLLIFRNNAKTSVLLGTDKELTLKTIQGMNSGRVNPNLNMIPKTNINQYWLLGFIEGEGTFGLKNLSPYFQIGQHVRSIHVMDNIQSYLLTLPNLFGFTQNSPVLKPAKTSPLSIANNQEIMVISYQNVDSLHDTLAFFLLNLSFQTRKYTDFLYWCLVLYMHKFGYFYLKKGRELTVAISNFINTSRYSNSGKVVSAPLIDQQLFLTVLPVTLTPNMSHLKLALAFAKVKGIKEVWVYENGVLIRGNPFNTYADVCEAIGISRKSLIVRRYIDTGKLYNNKYSFYSSLLSD